VAWNFGLACPGAASLSRRRHQSHPPIITAKDLAALRAFFCASNLLLARAFDAPWALDEWNAGSSGVCDKLLDEGRLRMPEEGGALATAAAATARTDDIATANDEVPSAKNRASASANATLAALVHGRAWLVDALGGEAAWGAAIGATATQHSSGGVPMPGTSGAPGARSRTARRRTTDRSPCPPSAAPTADADSAGCGHRFDATSLLLDASEFESEFIDALTPLVFGGANTRTVRKGKAAAAARDAILVVKGGS
jgi:hypothetical protein